MGNIKIAHVLLSLYSMYLFIVLILTFFLISLTFFFSHRVAVEFATNLLIFLIIKEESLQ